MGRYIKKYRAGGVNDHVQNRVSRIGRPPVSDFVDVPSQNPNRPPSQQEQMDLNQNNIINNQKEIIKQLQLNNQLIESQNTLLKNQNKLTSMTNSVRKLKTSDAGPKNSTKRKGGSKKEEKVIFQGFGFMSNGG